MGGRVKNPWVLYGVIAAVSVLLIAGAVVGGIWLWRRQVRKSLVGLVGRREAIRAAYRGLEAVFTSLAEEPAEELLAFAEKPDNVRRRALDELRARMASEADELENVALPKSAWPCADLLMAAAARVRDEIGTIRDANGPEAVLAAVGDIDVAAMRSAIAEAGSELDRLLHANKVDDPAVYGGGLYI
jgi:hypothetical protein